MVDTCSRLEDIKKLYGPGRILEQKQCRKLCTKDAVGEALGSECDASLEPSNWTTSTNYFHKGDTKDFVRATITDPKVHHKSSLKFGFQKPRYRCTTTGEFIWHKNADFPERAVPDNTVNIPDFCPNLAVGKPERDSIYTSSYTIDPSVPRPKPKPIEERKKYTNDLRETHFKLGSWDETKTTETQHSLGFDKSYDGLCNSNHVIDNNRHSSKVFRQGDWNQTDRHSYNKTITKRDFSAPSVTNQNELKFRHEFTDPSYHHASHFDLGTAMSADPTKLSSSLYHKDFNIRKVLVPAYERDQLLKEATSGTHSLDLFPKASKQLFKTTKETSFKDYGADKLLELKRERFVGCSNLKDRVRKDSHQIYHHQLNAGQNDLPNQRMLSLTSSNFQRPPLTNHKCDFEIPTNNHLSGNFAPMTISEAHEKYKPHQNSSSKTRHECNERRRDNKSTHFTLGNGPLERKITEQESQFRDRPPLDPSVHPAGKSLPAGQDYQHILSSTKQSSPHSIPQSSFMMDFKNPASYDAPPNDSIRRSRSSRWEEPLASHLFHTGVNDVAQSKGTHKTTTERDFISPIEQLMKQKSILGSRML